MSFRITHDHEAAFEFREAVAWYEGQADGLGVRFVHEVNEAKQRRLAIKSFNKPLL